MKSFPASSLRLDSGNGTMSRHRITARMWLSVTDSLQSFFRVLTQMSPFDDTFGW